MNLILDVGNSFVKLAVFQQDEMLQKWIVEKGELQIKIEEILSENPKIDKMIFSSVADASFALPKNQRKSVQVLVLGPETPLPFRNCYATPTTLGNDRKALIAGAAKRFKGENVLVIDAGTCLTFDFKNEQEEYLGGAISPGLNMRFKAVHTFTANLPLVEINEIPQLTGNTTENCIASGVYNGMLKEIDGIIESYKSEYQDVQIIFTGGDAHFLSMRLKNSIFANSNILLEGLNYILEFNHIQ